MPELHIQEGTLSSFLLGLVPENGIKLSKVGYFKPTKSSNSPLDWSKAFLKRASTKYCATIAKWALGEEESLHLGNSGAKIDETTICHWMKEGLGGFILEYDARPVAFINVQVQKNPPGTLISRIEVGRLLVDPDHRRSGFGSTLANNMFNLLLNAKKQVSSLNHAPICGRIVNTNAKGIGLTEKISLVKYNKWGGANIVHNKMTGIDEAWFRIPECNFQALGLKIRELREERNYTLQEFAFKCLMGRSTLNMIELGKRPPLPDILCKIINLLQEDSQGGRTKLVMTMFGEDVDEIIHDKTALLDNIHDEYQSLWIFTDILAELSSLQIFDHTIDALNKGFRRYYFLPKGKFSTDGKRLLDAILNKFNNKPLEDDLLRFYEVPAPLCELRISITNPRKINEFDTLTIGGAGDERITLPDERQEALFESINAQVNEVNFYLQQDLPAPDGCFQLLYPLPKGVNNGA